MMSMSITLMLGIVGGVWLLGMAAGLLGIWYGCTSSRRRFKLALGFTLGSLAAAYAGLKWVHFSFTKTTNGSSWSLNSRWFYLTNLGLALLALGLTIWRQMRHQPTDRAIMADGQGVAVSNSQPDAKPNP